MKRNAKTHLRTLPKQELVKEMLTNVTGGLTLPPIYAKCGNDSGVGPIGPKLDFLGFPKITCIAR